ncbi:MAG: glycine--tRNA ligase [Candidatus Diapherotrites archaeon]|nr:glycine--tRNA ligase [Candidatus Diapherotrites archaeon]
MAKSELDNLAARRALFFRSAEIYANAPSGFWEYGPIGTKIKNKIIEFWRKELVAKNNFLEIDGSIILPKDVFVASKHLESFNDPIVQCKKCNSLYRADKLLESITSSIVPESLSTAELTKMIKEHNAKCPKCNSREFTEVRRFNMMMRVDIGAAEQKQECYLRPETCQSIFLDFLRIYKTSRMNLPLGIAQVGKSFRNEISPRQSLLRSREFTQMEVEIFFNPKKIDEIENFDEVANYKLMLMRLGKGKIEKISCEKAVKEKIISGKLVAYYLARVQQFYNAIGIPIAKMRFRELAKDERAFYARETWDFEVSTSVGWVELMACNYRTDFDLAGHAKQSKQDLSVNEDGQKFIPHVFELSAGLDRLFYVLLDLSLRKEKKAKGERIYLDLIPRVAPFIAGVFPLVNKDGLDKIAREIYTDLLNNGFDVLFDSKGSIGRRYARIDEIGVPFAITVDYQTKDDNTVTIRERNSAEQKRVKIMNLSEIMAKLLRDKGYFKEL